MEETGYQLSESKGKKLSTYVLYELIGLDIVHTFVCCVWIQPFSGKYKLYYVYLVNRKYWNRVREDSIMF